MINYKNLLLTTLNLARSKVDYKLALVFKKQKQQQMHLL